jgi:hypothetical protein
MVDPFDFEGTNLEYRQFTKNELRGGKILLVLLLIGLYAMAHYFYINWATLSTGVGGN